MPIYALKSEIQKTFKNQGFCRFFIGISLWNTFKIYGFWRFSKFQIFCILQVTRKHHVSATIEWLLTVGAEKNPIFRELQLFAYVELDEVFGTQEYLLLEICSFPRFFRSYIDIVVEKKNS